MNPQEIRELIQELIQAIQLIRQNGEQLSDEMQGRLAQTFELLLTRLDEAERMGEQPPAEQPPLQQAMPSSNVEGFAYNPKTNEMFVRFLGQYPNRNGPIYKYDGVPQVIFDLFQSGMIPARTDGRNRWGRWWRGKTPSIGAALYSLVKTQGYPYQRIS